MRNCARETVLKPNRPLPVSYENKEGGAKIKMLKTDPTLPVLFFNTL